MADRSMVEKILRDVAHTGFMHAKFGGVSHDKVDLETEIELLCGMIDAEAAKAHTLGYQDARNYTDG